MQTRYIAAGAIIAMALAACSSGSTGGITPPPYVAPTIGPTTAPTTAPTSAPTATPTSGPSASPTTAPTNTPTTAPDSSLPTTGTAGGAAAYTDPSNGYTLYQLSADGNLSSVCTTSGGCTSLWPPLPALSTSVATGSFTPFTRSDGTHQWAYLGHPLYTYAGDSGAGQTNGNGVFSFGGTWTVERPAGTNGGSTPPPCNDPGYC